MEDKELFQRAREEIRTLRRENEILDAKVSTFDAVMSALHGKPATRSQGAMHPDVLFELEKRLSEAK